MSCVFQQNAALVVFEPICILFAILNTPQSNASLFRSPRAGSHTPSEDTRSNNHVVRQPAGPDGTQGFRQRR